MIPFIRSLSELMALTSSRDPIDNSSQRNKLIFSTIDSGQRKRYIRSIGEKEIGLPDLPKKTRRKWIKSKEAVSRFFNDLDYNNQIQSSYDLTLIGRQSQKNDRDVA
tara:strand:- start:27 stop:347 length:321 start_codon:yes stop_codon:yes gene_type:complete